MFKSVILVADNQQGSLDTTAKLLKEAGYATVKANSLLEARRKLEERRTHAAVLDVRLKDDDDDNDLSGVMLAKTAAPEMPKILYTAHPTKEVIRLACEHPTVTSIVGKDEDPDALVFAVASALRQSGLRASTTYPPGSLAWLRVLAVVWLPVAFGFGVTAMATNNPWWLLGTVAAGVLAVVFMGASLIKSSAR